MQKNFDLQNIKTIYLVQEQFQEAFLIRLTGEYKIIEDEKTGLLLVLSQLTKQNTCWEIAALEDVQVVQIDSINHCASILRQEQRDWQFFGSSLYRRSQLIQEKLRPLKVQKEIQFFNKDSWDSLERVGYFTLLAKDLMVYSKKSTSPFLGFIPQFVENRTEPPSRAYLKVVEAFYRAQKCPEAGDLCVELGASPGSWTWVLAKLKAKVFSYDRSELDPKISKMPGVTHACKDAFSVSATDFSEPVKWLLSDIICYPDKLYEFVQGWLSAKDRPNFICTIKFQGTEHYEWIDKFAAIEGSKVLHLYHNKHELTWINLKP